MNWTSFSEIVVLTGAGISVASGLGTYRGPGGLWEESGVAPAATAQGFVEDPWSVWQFFLPLLEQVLEVQPNAAHQALVKMEECCRGEFLLVTQNVDGLHTVAGSKNVAELHGNIRRRRCSNPNCSLEPHYDTTIPKQLPLCPNCGQPLRPDIVLFGEMIPVDPGHRAKRALRTVNLFLAIGTSGTVMPAASFVRSAEYAGALTVEMNLAASGAFQTELLGPAEETLPALVEAGLDY